MVLTLLHSTQQILVGHLENRVQNRVKTGILCVCHNERTFKILKGV